jgi:hypothetical protein
VLGPLFQDHAVLQRGRLILVGDGGRGVKRVSVALAGHWPTSARTGRALDGTLQLDAGGRSVRVRTGSGEAAGFGRACRRRVPRAGQSNMELPVGQSRNGSFCRSAVGERPDPLLTVPKAGKPSPPAFETRAVAGGWSAAVRLLSALATTSGAKFRSGTSPLAW